jgi:signal recognition particle GTPase
MGKTPYTEPPTITRTLRWDQASLLASISEADVDQVIFSVMTSRLRKTAMVVAQAHMRREELGLPIKFVGLGEQADDLQPFDAKQFAAALFAE